MDVTTALHFSSFHVLTSSPVLLSQVRTCSFAATMLCPVPGLDDVPLGVQTRLAVLDTTTPNDFAGSNLLKPMVSCYSP